VYGCETRLTATRNPVPDAPVCASKITAVLLLMVTTTTLLPTQILPMVQRQASCYAEELPATRRQRDPPRGSSVNGNVNRAASKRPINVMHHNRQIFDGPVHVASQTRADRCQRLAYILCNLYMSYSCLNGTKQPSSWTVSIAMIMSYSQQTSYRPSIY